MKSTSSATRDAHDSADRTESRPIADEGVDAVDRQPEAARSRARDRCVGEVARAGDAALPATEPKPRRRDGGVPVPNTLEQLVLHLVRRQKLDWESANDVEPLGAVQRDEWVHQTGSAVRLLIAQRSGSHREANRWRPWRT